MLLAVWLLFCAALCLAEDGPQVETKLGRARGVWLSARNGRKYQAFMGLPYAKPPVGKIRFQPPEPAEPWEGLKEATKTGPYCIQFSSFANGSLSPNQVGVEDCLYLNVYTHDVKGNAPVLVHYHGGAFLMGNQDMGKPTYLMDHDIVIVDVNYRLGIFGFLSFEDEVLPGNQGLKDQTMALRWVQEHVRSFGGDPDRVTIMGESAGGASVYHHTVSPLSRGLFHRGITSSGTSFNPWALSPPGLARSNAEKLMGLIGCPTSSKEALACALQKDASEIILQFPEFWMIRWMFGGDPFLTFSPTLEAPRPGAFLTNPIEEWKHSKVPLIMTMSSAEGLLRTLFFLQDLNDIAENFEKQAPILLSYWASASNPDEVTRKVRDYYLSNEVISTKNFQQLTDMFSDAWFTSGIIEGANKHKGDVYFLYYDRGDTGFMKSELVKGSNHCGEMYLVFESNMPMFPKPEFTPELLKLSQDLVKSYVDFMKTGEVSMEGVKGKWKPWSAKKKNYLLVDEEGLHLKEGLLQDRYYFWRTLGHRDLFQAKSKIQREEL